jgi:regulation of enolase protein 1 (concanavalin A-like superfamily)
VTASTTWSVSYPASNAVDGNASTRWSAASGQTANQWLLVDFGAATGYSSVVIKEISFQRVTAFKIQSSTDGTTFSDLATGTTIGTNLTVTFLPVLARYVRLYMTSASNVPTINEFEVYGSGSGDGTVAAPTFSPAGGTYASAQTVTISTTNSGASIRYTTDGSNPSETTGTLYSSPVTISTTTTLKAIAYESGFTDSSVTSDTYTINSANGALPTGWTDSDIGSIGVPGSAVYTNGVFTVKGSGADIYGTSDQFNYAREVITNDFTLTARVATLNSANGWSKSGVMIRGSAATNSAYVGIYVTTSNGVDMQCRTSNGAGAVDMARVSGVAAPYWVRLVRSGNTFTGYHSANGTTWTQVSSTNVTMAASVRAGLAVCAHDNTALNTSTFDNVTAQ